MKPTLYLGATALVFASLAAPATAATVLTGVFSGSQEAPPVTTPGTRTGTVTLNDTNTAMSISIVFSGLTSPTQAGHIHCCSAPGANSSVAIGFNAPAFPLGVQSGSFDQTFDLTLASNYTSAFLTASGGTADLARARLVTGLQSGLAYLNIHTGQFPGGEIRANIGAVPEPTSWAMMIAGFGLVGGALRARRSVKIALTA